MAEPLPLFWHDQPVGTVLELSADMYWWRARWQPNSLEALEALRSAVDAGEDPQVVIGGDRPLRLVVTAVSDDELELKNAS